MRFLHTVDMHWDMTLDNDSPWSREQYQAIKDTFTQIITRTRDVGVNCFLISGDLFHRQPLARDLKEVSYPFITIPGVRIIIITGNHGRIWTNSTLLGFAWASNTTFVVNGEMTSVYFENINMEIRGFSYHTMDIKENWIEDIKTSEDGRIHILMIHDGDATYLPFDHKSLAETGFSYVTLGHIHEPEIIAEGRTAYPGSPRLLDKTETGPHGVLLGEINSVTLKLESLNSVPLGRSQYIPPAINITPSTTDTELDLHISQGIEKHERQNLCQLRIRGMCGPDSTSNFENLRTRYRAVEVLDEIESQHDFGALLAEYPGDMIGFYTQTLRRPEMSSVERKALHYDISTLLHTTDERNQP